MSLNDFPRSHNGILNPRLGQLNDGGYAFQQWQQRMLSCRRRRYERDEQRNSNSFLSERSKSRGHNSAAAAIPTTTGAGTTPILRTSAPTATPAVLRRALCGRTNIPTTDTQKTKWRLRRAEFTCVFSKKKFITRGTCVSRQIRKKKKVAITTSRIYVCFVKKFVTHGACVFW